jgi:hypothetical protein
VRHRLLPGREIDDRETAVAKPDAAPVVIEGSDETAFAVRPPMRHSIGHPFQMLIDILAALQVDKSCYATH